MSKEERDKFDKDEDLPSAEEVWDDFFSGKKNPNDDLPVDETEHIIDDIGAKKEREEQKEKEKESKQEQKEYSKFGKNCIYYKTNSEPDRWIGGTEDNRLVEYELKHDRNGNPYYRMTRSFTTCKPVEITQHKSVLDFLELPQLYTIKFIGNEKSGRFTLKQKTMSEISSEIRDTNGLSETGIDIALRTQLKAFEVAELIKENDDIKYTGFFSNQECDKIISSGIEFKEVNEQVLIEALDCIDKLAEKGFVDRLDLLAHVIKFGFIAPFAFIFKCIRAPCLTYFHLYGPANSTKSSSEEIILAFDGHHKDEKFIVTMGQVNTDARIGEVISQTTFPILLDELDYYDDKKLMSNIKTSVTNEILRNVLDKFRRKTRIPALSPFACSSNTEPPNETGFRKRILVRQSLVKEMHNKNSDDAIEFDKLKADFDKLYILGDFRNNFIMENQDIILDKKQTPFEKSLTIIEAVYKKVGKVIPDWLVKGQLEESNLEQILDDAKESVLDAIKNIIIREYRFAFKEETQSGYTNRLAKLIDGDHLSFAYRQKSSDLFAINTGIIKRIYENGVTKEELPNLKILADYMNAKWGRSNSKTFIEISIQNLEKYLDE